MPKFSIVREVLKKARWGVILRAVWASCCSVHPQNKEPSVGILLGPELRLARQGGRHFQALLHIHDIFNMSQGIYISVCCCFCVFTTLTLQSEMIADVSTLLSRPPHSLSPEDCSQLKVTCGGPNGLPSLFGCFSFFSLLSFLIIFPSILLRSLWGFISADLSKTAPLGTRSKVNKIGADCINFTDNPLTTSVVG